MKTATIERYHVWGTPNHCFAMFYRENELTPTHSPTCPTPQWIPDDEQGRVRLLRLAHMRGFTHIRYAGDWDKRTKPHGGLIVNQLKA